MIYHCLKSVPLLFIPIEKKPRNLEFPSRIKEFWKGISIPVLNEIFKWFQNERGNLNILLEKYLSEFNSWWKYFYATWNVIPVGFSKNSTGF